MHGFCTSAIVRFCMLLSALQGALHCTEARLHTFAWTKEVLHGPWLFYRRAIARCETLTTFFSFYQLTCVL